jgi:mannose-6-phosphate isomerase-like protein (cupin superfamily)
MDMITEHQGLIIGPGSGSVLTNPIGGQMTAKLRDADTAHGFSLFDNILPAGSPGPRPHRHHHHEETFVVLEGELTIQIESDVHTLPAGSVVLIPRGVAHRPANRSAQPTRVLLIFSPGGMDGFFADAAAERLPLQGGAVSPEQQAAMAAFCEKYSFEFADLPDLT